MQKTNSLFSHQLIRNLDGELEKIFKSVPHLPKKIIEVLAKIAPYLILVSGLFMITGGLRSIFGVGEFYRVFSYWSGISASYFYISGVLQIAAGIISVMAYKPLRDYKIEGWYMLFCLTLLELLMNIVSVFFLKNGFFGLLFSLLLSMYMLYEIKPAYKSIKLKAAKAVKKVVKKAKSKTKKK